MDAESRPLVELILAGVPEQVNIPINICLERSIFKKHGVNVTFRLVPEGTGAMLNLLENGDVDLALTVTDAFMVGKASGRKVNLLGTFVESPLVWAVAARTKRDDVTSIPELLALQNYKFGVSRLGSGSHTMAYYMCSLHGKATESSSFVIANNFDGLKKGIQDQTFDAFLWETFTTKPSCERGEVKKIGEVPTPWSAFSFVSGLGVSEEKSAAFLKLFEALAEGCEVFKANETAHAIGVTGSARSESSVQRICREFGHTEEDAALWLSRCRYTISPGSPPMAVDRTVTDNSVRTLKEIGLIPKEFLEEDLWGGVSNTVIRFKN